MLLILLIVIINHDQNLTFHIPSLFPFLKMIINHAKATPSRLLQQLIILLRTPQHLAGVLFLQPQFLLIPPQRLYLLVVILNLLLVDLGLLYHVLLEGQPLLHEPVVLLLLQLPLLHL